MNLLARLRHRCDLGWHFRLAHAGSVQIYAMPFPCLCLPCVFPPCLLAPFQSPRGGCPPKGAILRHRSKSLEIHREYWYIVCRCNKRPGRISFPSLRGAPPDCLPRRRRLELLLLLEEHGEADDGAVDQETADDRHEHGWDLNETRVCEDDREYWNQKSAVSSAINPSRTGRGIFT